MNRLEQYIHDHKGLFDEEPADGHFRRWQQKTEHKHRKTVVLQWAVSVAASLVLLFSAGIIWQETEKQKTELALCGNADNLKICYLDKINNVAGQIEHLTKDFDQWDQRLVMDEVHNIIEAIDNFEDEIPVELPEEKVKLILADYYQRNLDSLVEIIETIK